jgi:hypothetical protein
MSRVFFDSGVSLDGFLAGENRGPKNPIGDGGPTIHQWMYQQKAFWKHLGQEGGKEEGADKRALGADGTQDGRLHHGQADVR